MFGIVPLSIPDITPMRSEKDRVFAIRRCFKRKTSSKAKQQKEEENKSSGEHVRVLTAFGQCVWRCGRGVRPRSHVGEGGVGGGGQGYVGRCEARAMWGGVKPGPCSEV